MADRATVTCRDCNSSLVLPEDAESLAVSMTAFVDRHNRLQHYDVSLDPGAERASDSAVGR